VRDGGGQHRRGDAGERRQAAPGLRVGGIDRAEVESAPAGGEQAVDGGGAGAGGQAAVARPPRQRGHAVAGMQRPAKRWQEGGILQRAAIAPGHLRRQRLGLRIVQDHAVHLTGEADGADACAQLGRHTAHQRFGAGDDALGILLVASVRCGQLGRVHRRGGMHLDAGTIDQRQRRLARADVDAEGERVHAGMLSPMQGGATRHGPVLAGVRR